MNNNSGLQPKIVNSEDIVISLYKIQRTSTGHKEVNKLDNVSRTREKAERNAEKSRVALTVISNPKQLRNNIH